MIDSPHSKFPHVYAIVRIDFPVDVNYPENSFNVVKVLASKSVAEQEVIRLNKVNADKRCRYVLNITRLNSETGLKLVRGSRKDAS